MSHLHDTSPEAQRLMVALYRRMPAERKLRQVGELYDFAMGLTRADVRRRHPGAGERECRLRAASRFMEREILRRACGWDPGYEGY